MHDGWVLLIHDAELPLDSPHAAVQEVSYCPPKGLIAV